MDITDTSSKHCYTEVSNWFTFIRVSTLPHTDNAVFFTTDWTNFCFKWKTFVFADFNKFFSLFNILFNWIVGTIKHNWWKSCINAVITSFICSMVKVKCNRNSNLKIIYHCTYHTCYGLKSCHIFTSTTRYTEDNWWVHLLSCKKNRFSPLKIIDIELPNSIFAISGFF